MAAFSCPHCVSWGSLSSSVLFYNRHTGFSLTGVYVLAVGLFVNTFALGVHFF